MNNNIKKSLREIILWRVLNSDCLKTMMNIWYARFSITFLVHQQFHQHYSPVINRNISKQIRLVSHTLRPVSSMRVAQTVNNPHRQIWRYPDLKAIALRLICQYNRCFWTVRDTVLGHSILWILFSGALSFDSNFSGMLVNKKNKRYCYYAKCRFF